MKQLTLLIMLLASIHQVSAAVRHTIGIARDAQDNSVRYIEHHQYDDNGQHEVRYFDPSQNILLEKLMAYDGLPQHPSIVQRDYLRDTQVEVRYGKEVATMVTSQGDKSEQFTFDISPEIVVDAGFDAYIRDNWARFDQQSRQEVTFAIAGQSRLLPMKIERTDVREYGASFRVIPANWLVRMLFPEIRLNYDENRHLVRYEGFTNLKTETNQSRDVVIEFSHYFLGGDLAQPLPQWLPSDAAE